MSSASRKLIQASGAVAGPADTGDDDFANVVLLLDGDGTSGDDNNTFTDSSTNSFTVTETGSVVQGSFSPYGDNWSNYFDSNYLYASSSANFNLSSGNWTIEGWLYTIDTSYGERYVVLEGSSQNFGLIRGNNNTVEWNFFGTSALITSSTNSVLPNTWVHFAVVSNSGTITLYVDGVSQGTTTTYPQNSNTQVTLAASVLRYVSTSTNTYISNLRIVKGTAIYTSSFTSPTDPLTAVTNTQLLTCQSNRFIDNSSNGHTITVNGTPKVTPFSPFKDNNARDITTDGGSGYFDGASNADLVIADSDNLSAEAQDFTLEAWVYVENAGGSNKAIWSKWGSGTQEILFGISSNNLVAYISTYSAGTPLLTSSTSVGSGWNHVALTRNGNAFDLWLNGVNTASATQAGSIQNQTANVTIGDYSGGGWQYYGYMSDIRWVKGTAVYTSAFTPPTAPLTAITNTELLLNFQDAGIYDLTGLNNLDTVGNAQIDTAVKKYGTGSLQFDGTGDYLIAGPTDELAPGDGDFTVEFWMYGITNNFYNGLYHNYPDALNRTTAFRIVTNTTDQTSLLVSTAATTIITTSSGVVTASAWNHVALVRNGSSLVLYVNGTSAGSTTNTTNFSDGYAIIGNAAYGGTDYFFNGYVDDFRITKGIARYTANFTAPDAALPKF